MGQPNCVLCPMVSQTEISIGISSSSVLTFYRLCWSMLMSMRELDCRDLLLGHFIRFGSGIDAEPIGPTKFIRIRGDLFEAHLTKNT